MDAAADVATSHAPTAGPAGHVKAVPIADYGFLSDGEVTALVAPGGDVDWMCLPRLDSPSVFGAVLGRHSGRFRLGPSDVSVPTARRYLPGTMVLETSWGTPTGLDHRPRRAAHRAVAARRRRLPQAPAYADGLRRRAHAPADDPVRLGRGADGDGVRAGARLRAPAGDVDVHRPRLPPGAGVGRGVRPHAHAHDGPAARLRGRAGRGENAPQGGRRPLHRPLVGRPPAAHGLRAGVLAARVDRAPLAALARPRTLPRPPVAQLPPAECADAEGPDVCADRRDRRGVDDVAAGDHWWRAQLRLPLHVDP